MVAAARRLERGCEHEEETCTVTDSPRPSSWSDTISAASSSASPASERHADFSDSPDAAAERVVELEALLAEKNQRVEEMSAQLRRTQEELERLSGRHERQQVLLQIRSLQHRSPQQRKGGSEQQGRSSRVIRRTYGVLDIPTTT